MDQKSDLVEYLNTFGLDNEDIESIKTRNSYFTLTLKEDAEEVFNFLLGSCKLNKNEIRHIVLNNPLILNESTERLKLLDTMYKELGLKGNDYKKYLVSFDKAFSLNPKDVYSKVASLAGVGKNRKEIKEMILKDGYNMFIF